MSVYGDKTIDILTFQNLALVGDKQVTLQLGDPGMYCTGIQKVAQSFAALFLTDVGSVVNDPLYGTSFMSSLRNGFVYDEAGLTTMFHAAVLDVMSYLDNNQPDAAADEKLTDVELVSWTMVPGALNIKVKLTTAAGTSRLYYLPVPTGAL